MRCTSCSLGPFDRADSWCFLFPIQLELETGIWFDKYLCIWVLLDCFAHLNSFDLTRRIDDLVSYCPYGLVMMSGYVISNVEIFLYAH